MIIEINKKTKLQQKISQKIKHTQENETADPRT